MFFKLMTLVHLCAAFPLKCPEPTHWRLRANSHCADPSKYSCVKNDIINGYSENCTWSDFQQAGRISVLRGGIDADICSKERYQPYEYIFYTNASTNCILLKTLCNEEGQVVYDQGDRNTDATCRCDYRRGYDFVIKPNNLCFCKPSREDCSCFLKICSNSSHILSPDYKCTINSDLQPVTHCRAITDVENDNNGRNPDVKHTLPKEDNVSVHLLEPWTERSIIAILSIFGVTLMSFILVVCIRQYKAFQNNGPEPELNLIEGDTLKLQYMLPIKRLRLGFFKGDTLIAETVNVKKHVLEKTNVTLGDQGNYFSKVCNIRSRITKVTVQSMFTSEFNTIKCIKGEMLQLKCSVYLEGINVEWSKDDAKIRQNENISIEIDGKDHCLTIQQAKLSDAGRYMMVAGNVRKQVTVIVEAMFTSEYIPIKCVEGGTLQLKCSVYSEGINVEWSKDDAKIRQNENISIEIDGKDHCLTIQQAKLSDAGQYMMVAGNVRKQATVTVEAMFTSELNPIKCIEGETLQLKCSVYSEDAFLEWFKGDVRINENENLLIESDGMHHCMTIQPAKLSDAGQYNIVARNVRKQVTVNVQAMFTSEFNQINCIIGEKLQLKCSVYLENVNVEWFKNDKKIFENENISIENDGKYHFMTVQKADMKDAGQYIIKAGNVQNQLAVTVKVLPEAINRLQEIDRTRYIELMQSSEVEKRYYVRIMVVGKESVGKTSLVRRLLMKNIDDVVSTDGVDIVVDQCKINIEDGSWLIDGSSDDKIDRISRALNSIPNKRSIKEESNISRSKESNNGNKQVEDVANSLEDMNNTTLYQTETSTNMVDRMSANSTSKGKISGVDIGSRSMSTSDTKDTDQTENYHESDIKDIENLIKTGSKDALTEHDDTNHALSLVMPRDLMSRVFTTTSASNIPSNHYALCGLWDFAGQKEFYATHQAFLTNSAIYLVVADMKDDISKQDASQYSADFKNVGEYVDFWFDTIHCHRSVEPPEDEPFNEFIDPPVILVLTGKDKCGEETIGNTLIEERKTKIQTQLDMVLGDQHKYHHLRDIICISNTTDPDVKFVELQQKISSIILGMAHWGQYLPLKWILLEHLIEINKTDGNNFINFSDMENLAKHNDINMKDIDEVKLFLRFQHEVGNVIYFEDIQDFIILNPKWLVDAFRCLVSDKIDGRLQHRTDWTKFKQNGTISEYLITELFKSKCGNQFLDQRENLFKVMEKFDILVKIAETSSYIMPSMMTPVLYDEVCTLIGIKQPNCKRSSWLCLKFSFLPPAFFNHVSVWFIKEYESSKVVYKTHSLALFRGICVFDIDSKSGCEKILVTMSKDTIAIQLLSFLKGETEFGSKCSRVCKGLIKQIQAIKDRYRLSMSCKIHFKCSEGDYSRDTKSYEDLKSSTEYYCSQHTCVHQSEEIYLPWMLSTDNDATMENNKSSQGFGKKEILQEELNFIRMSLLLRKISPCAVRAFFDSIFHPSLLGECIDRETNKLNDLKNKRIISQMQWNLLFPRTGSRYSTMFDVTLMITLLTNIAKLNHYSSFPVVTDTTPAADMKRIKYYRNHIAHNTDGQIDNSFFNTAWDDITGAVGRLGGKHMLDECKEVKTRKFEKSSVPLSIEEQISSNLVQWRMADSRFVETRASKHVWNCVQENSCVTITASGGVGKTAILQHVTLKMANEGYNVLIVNNSQDIVRFYNPNQKTLFVMDNFCGTYSINQFELNCLKSVIERIKHLITNKLTKIIVACRLQVYQDHKFEVCSMFRTCVCNLQSEYLRLSQTEKLAIANLYLETKASEIMQYCDLYECFPLICKVYDVNSGLNIKDFFKNPFPIYEAEFDRLQKLRNNGKYCVLALFVMFNNRLNGEWLTEEVNEKIRTTIRNTCEVCRLDRATSRLVLLEELKTLEYTFIKKDKGVYKTIHDKLFDFLSFYFGQKMIQCLINNADSELIMQRLLIERKDDMDQFITIVPRQYHQMYIQRLISDWSEGMIHCVFNNINMKIPVFRERFLGYLNTLDIPFQKQLVLTCDVKNKDTVLLQCCQYDDIPLIQWCINHGIDVNQCNYKGISPLYISAQAGLTKVVMLLLDNKAEINKCGVSPLFFACLENHKEIVKLLLDKNAVIDKGMDDATSPLLIAKN